MQFHSHLGGKKVSILVSLLADGMIVQNADLINFKLALLTVLIQSLLIPLCTGFGSLCLLLLPRFVLPSSLFRVKFREIEVRLILSKLWPCFVNCCSFKWCSAVIQEKVQGGVTFMLFCLYMDVFICTVYKNIQRNPVSNTAVCTQDSEKEAFVLYLSVDNLLSQSCTVSLCARHSGARHIRYY